MTVDDEVALPRAKDARLRDVLPRAKDARLRDVLPRAKDARLRDVRVAHDRLCHPDARGSRGLQLSMPRSTMGDGADLSRAVRHPWWSTYGLMYACQLRRMPRSCFARAIVYKGKHSI